MKKILVVVVLMTSQIWAQNDSATCKILSKINALIQKEHVQPKPVDDSLSVFVFDNLINDLDPARNLFFKSEYDSLAKKYRLHIDDLIQKGDCQFISTIENIYQKGLLRNKAFLEKLEKDSIDFTVRDTIRMYKKVFPVYMTESDFDKIWRKKYALMF